LQAAKGILWEAPAEDPAGQDRSRDSPLIRVAAILITRNSSIDGLTKFRYLRRQQKVTPMKRTLSFPSRSSNFTACINEINESTAAQRRRRRNSSRWFVLSIALSIITAAAASAQIESARSLAERSAIIVRGKVLKANASDEPLVEASESTAVITVLQMYAGTEIAGDQKGRTVTVILSAAGKVKAGEEAFFLGNPRFSGNTLTIADEGEIPARDADTSTLNTLDRGTQSRRDKPIIDRLATADLVFRGAVETIHPLAANEDEKRRGNLPPSEHDPDWQVAAVRVIAPIRGGERGKIVEVLFPASRDVVWFNAPKLRPNQEAVFIAHKPAERELDSGAMSALAALKDKSSIYLVTAPFDVLPSKDDERVRFILKNDTAKEKN
jgi:hypothetical protein